LRTNADQVIALGIGDDCALIKAELDDEIAITSAMLATCWLKAGILGVSYWVARP
jgi:thiamine monophosphate kinase